jgi:hypothetical protein
MVFLVGMAAVGVAACSSNSSSPTTTASATTSKAVFCGFNATLDKAGSSVTSASDFLNVLKANKAAIDGLANNLPNDSIKTQAQALINAARTAVANNSTSGLSDPSLSADGAALDTYCGVQGDGSPLPANFGTGKGSGFCADEAAISAGLGNAATPADAITFLKANQAKINDFAANIPAAVQSDAQSLVTAAQAAVAANDGTLIQTQAVQTAGNNVDLYCGVNH